MNVTKRRDPAYGFKTLKRHLAKNRNFARPGKKKKIWTRTYTRYKSVGRIFSPFHTTEKTKLWTDARISHKASRRAFSDDYPL